MMFYGACVFLLYFFKYNFAVSLANEPMCSKFSCEEQLLEKMIRQEIKVEIMQNNIEKTQEAVADILEEEIKKTSAKVSQTLESAMERITREKEKNEEILKKTFEEQRNNFTSDMEEGRRMLKELAENMKKPSVAFFAHNVVDLKLDKTDKIIIFTTATTNEGSGYETSTGIFTAPVGGLYQFIVHYCTYIKEHSTLALVLSGNVIARSHNYDESSSTCSFFSAVIRVKSSEKIWVKCLSGSSSYTLHTNNWMMNSFSGILINK